MTILIDKTDTSLTALSAEEKDLYFFMVAEGVKPQSALANLETARLNALAAEKYNKQQ